MELNSADLSYTNYTKIGSNRVGYQHQMKEKDGQSFDENF